jgi:hypothetical protein
LGEGDWKYTSKSVDYLWVFRGEFFFALLDVVFFIQARVKGHRLVTDSLLSWIAPDLNNLEHLQIVGCDRVTHVGIANVLAYSQVGIRTLHLQQLSPSFVRLFSVDITLLQALVDLANRT